MHQERYLEGSVAFFICFVRTAPLFFSCFKKELPNFTCQTTQAGGYLLTETSLEMGPEWWEDGRVGFFYPMILRRGIPDSGAPGGVHDRYLWPSVIDMVTALLC